MPTNRLIHEKSPYLLQHAHNPVDWYPWGEEAFAEAKRLDKPIFLSIGYATCHWCHVMEKESFENEAVAEELNDLFVCIKVDREELPEVDALYMDFAQSMMSGSAGWPLNVILTPDRQPFFATTYLPPRSSEGSMGLDDLVQRIRAIWQDDERASIVEQAGKVVEIFAENIETTGETMPPESLVQLAAETFYKVSDPIYGGLRGAPKFPLAYQAIFLLTYSSYANDSRAHFLAERTLEMMARGGICDQLGGGFCRYSVDERWMIPHFEKMLYDNAMIADAYLKLWQVSQEEEHARVVSQTLDYVLRELTGEHGGFYSAEDADAGGQEGSYYTWEREEVANILGPDLSQLFCQYYQITPEGNFHGRNVLYAPQSVKDFCQQNSLKQEEIERVLDEARRLLFAAREKRKKPLIDDKCITAWNGLMIHTMVRASLALQDPQYLDAAEAAADFLRKNLFVEGKLFRRWREGEAQFAATLDDYVHLIRGLLSLFEADRGSQWLEWAMELEKHLSSQFKSLGGSYYQTDGTDPYLLLRRVSYSDGAEPSANAIHTENLLRLHMLTLQGSYLTRAEDILRAVSRLVQAYPPGYSYHAMNILRYYAPEAACFVIALNEKEEGKLEIQQKMHGHFYPIKSVVWRREENKKLFQLLPFVANQKPVEGQTTAYVCHKGGCEEPIVGVDNILQTLLTNGAGRP